MATDLGKAFIQIVPSADGIKGGIEKVLGKDMDQAGEKSGKLFGSKLVEAATKFITAAAISKTILSSLKQGAALEQSLGGIETLFKDSADKIKGFAQNAYKDVGISANEYMENVTGFSASLLQSLGGDTNKAADIANMAMIDMADNSAKMGTSMEAIQNAYQGFAKQNYTMLDNLKLGYGGTQSEMKRLLNDATKLTGIKYDINNLSDVYEAIHAIQGELGITGTTAKEASETLAGSFNSMKSAFMDLIGNLALGENVSIAMQNLMQTMATFVFGNLLPMLFNIMQKLPEMISTFWTTAIPIIQEQGGKMISSLYTSIKDKAPEMLKSGTEMAKNFIKGFFENMPENIKKVGELMVNLVDTVLTFAPHLLEAGFELISALAGGLWNNLPVIVMAIGEVLKNLIVSLVKHFPEIKEKGKEIIFKLIEGIAHVAGKAVETVVNLINSFIDNIKAKYEEFKTNGAALIDNIKQGIVNKKNEILTVFKELIQNKIQSIKDKFEDFKRSGAELIDKIKLGVFEKKEALINSVKDIIESGRRAILNFKDKFFNVGKDLINGIIDGVKQKAQAMVDSVTRVAKDAIGGVKNFLGINSPSRVFRDEIGRFIPEGMAIGIIENIKPVQKAMEQLESATSSEFSKDIAYSISTSALSADKTADSLKDSEDKDKPLNLILSIGGKSFKAFVEDISRVQQEEVEIELAY